MKTKKSTVVNLKPMEAISEIKKKKKNHLEKWPCSLEEKGEEAEIIREEMKHGQQAKAFLSVIRAKERRHYAQQLEHVR